MYISLVLYIETCEVRRTKRVDNSFDLLSTGVSTDLKTWNDQEGYRGDTQDLRKQRKGINYKTLKKSSNANVHSCVLLQGTWCLPTIGAATATTTTTTTTTTTMRDVKCTNDAQ